MNEGFEIDKARKYFDEMGLVKVYDALNKIAIVLDKQDLNVTESWIVAHFLISAFNAPKYDKMRDKMNVLFKELDRHV